MLMAGLDALVPLLAAELTMFPVSTASVPDPSASHLLISRFSCTNFTLASVSADSSIAWLKPFSPPVRTGRQAGGCTSGLEKGKRFRCSEGQQGRV